MDKKQYKIGVISDTHGKLNPEVLDLFKDVDHIIHAGDICGTDVLHNLKKIAPLTAVKGNMDFGELTSELNPTESIKLGQVFIYILHIQHMLDIEPDAKGFNVVITGHTHIPLIESKKSVLYINPGSATFPKHNNSPTIAFLYIAENKINAEIVELK